MTQIRINLGSWADPDDETGYGTARISPNKPIISGEKVLMGQPRTYPIPPGGAEIELPPTGPGEFYRMHIANQLISQTFTEAVRVQDSADPVTYASLERIDPRKPKLYYS